MKNLVPTKIKEFYWKKLQSQDKHEAELSFWRGVWEEEGHQWDNEYYKRHMLSIAGEQNDNFLKNKIVADFGCGPRGSLWWAEQAKLRIGIDVLADAYAEFDIKSVNMAYVVSSETSIPLPSGYIDILYTVNALDHVYNLEIMCRELLRILAPGGEFIASFNLGEEANDAEPQSLDEEILDKLLLNNLNVTSYKVRARARDGNPYTHFFDDSPTATTGERYLWVRATKPS